MHACTPALSLLAITVGAADAASGQFVEPVTIIHEFRGEQANDEFGWVARRIGDVDRDGVADFVTTAPHTSDQTSTGHVYVYSSKSGQLLWKQTGQSGDRLGMGCDRAGDVNADGVPDVVAGAVGSGRAHVYSGDDGRILLTVHARKPGDVFGFAVSPAGDWNGDGHDDFLVGARRADEAGQDAGAAYLYSGKDGAILHELRGEEPGDFYGSEMSGFSDGKQHILAIGAMNAGNGDRGRVYVYRGQEPRLWFVIDAGESGAMLGRMFVNIFGDADADGVPDIYASDWNDAALGRNTGRVYVYSTARAKKLYEWGGDAPGIGYGIGAGDAGDIDHDGHADLIIGAWNESSGAKNAGKVYVYSGKSGRTLREITCNVENDTFGFDTTHVGDVDGDGVNDLLITAAWATIDGDAKRGRIFIISGATP